MTFAKLLKWVQWIFSAWPFATLTLAVLTCFEALMVLALVLPSGDSGVAAFAEEFRRWCFGYDPATGSMEWMYAAMMLAHPLVIGAMIGLLWREPLALAWAQQRKAIGAVAAVALGVVLGGVISLSGMGSGAADDGELPFPAEALRTEHVPPPISLVNQDGQAVSLESVRGKVVVVTGIYATCGHTCPLIMAQLKRSLERLSVQQRGDVRVLAITLNPEHDDQEVMREAAHRYSVSSPQYHFLSGTPDRVNPLLDRLQIARKKNTHTGVIEHANLFIVIDRNGRLAYRFALGDRQERWLSSALALLADERTGV